MKIFFAAIAFCATLLLRTQAVPLETPAPPSLIRPWPVAVAYATTHQISIDGIDGVASSEIGRAGDSITVLTTFRAGSIREQWLTELMIATPSAKESADNPPQSMTFKSPASGRSYQFGTGAKLAIDIRTVGPFVEGRDSLVVEKRGRVYIGPELLGIGLDKSCRTSVKQMEEQGSVAQTDRSSSVKPKPIISSESEEKETYGAVYSLVEFLRVVIASPELFDILWRVADKPSAWSIIKHGGSVGIGIDTNGNPTVVDPANWALPEFAHYRFPIVIGLNEKPALRCTLVVTSPRPPLLTCAGIVGISAEPAENSNKRLEICIIAAHRSSL